MKRRLFISLSLLSLVVALLIVLLIAVELTFDVDAYYPKEGERFPRYSWFGLLVTERALSGVRAQASEPGATYHPMRRAVP